MVEYINMNEFFLLVNLGCILHTLHLLFKVSDEITSVVDNNFSINLDSTDYSTAFDKDQPLIIVHQTELFKEKTMVLLEVYLQDL